MRHRSIIGLVALSVLHSAWSYAAEKPADRPDPEMLRMMEFLKDWEMLKHMELLKEMQQVRADGKTGDSGSRNSPAPKAKENVK